MNKGFKIISLFIVLVVVLVGCKDKSAIIGDYHKFADYNFKGMDVMSHDNMSNIEHFSISEGQEIYNYLLKIKSEESSILAKDNTSANTDLNPHYIIALYFEENDYSLTVGKDYIIIGPNQISEILDQPAKNASIHLVSEKTIDEFIGLITNTKMGSKHYAKAFLERVTHPEDLESTKHFRGIFYSGEKNQYTIEEYSDSILKDYGYLMTDKAFDNAVANTFIPWAEIIREDTNYNIKVDSIDLVQKDVYDDGRVQYSYSISLSVLLADGENKPVTVSGDIVMIEENGTWLVDAFKQNPDYGNLNKLLFPHPNTQVEMFSLTDEIWVNTGEEVNVEVDQDQIIGEIKLDDIWEMTDISNKEDSKIIGSTYAYYEDSIIVKIEDKWILFSTIEDWARDNDIKLGKVFSIGYDVGDVEEIFGDLNQEEINKITEEIMNRIKKDKDYEKNKDLIIEQVFIENGITDQDKIKAAKSKLIITK